MVNFQQIAAFRLIKIRSKKPSLVLFVEQRVITVSFGIVNKNK